jgi:hypothetical protein
MFLQRDQSILWVFHGPLRAQGSNRLLFLMCSISEMSDGPASWANADLEADGKTRAPGAAGQRTPIRLWKPRCNTGPPQGPSRRRAPQAAHSTEAAFGDPARSAPCRMRPVFPLRQIQRLDVALLAAAILLVCPDELHAGEPVRQCGSGSATPSASAAAFSTTTVSFAIYLEHLEFGAR